MLGNACAFITVLILIKSASTKNISFDVVDGEYARIADFPYVVFILISKGEGRYSSCGASILNQDILLTAAHCVIGDTFVESSIVAFTGHANKYKGKQIRVSDLKIHEKYIPNIFEGYDIALLILEKELTFGRLVRRVVLMSRPPFEEGAEIAGWGRIMEQTKDMSYLLKYTKQRVLLRETCVAQMCIIPPDSFCARHPMGYSHRGDSGSALVVRRYIQIGIVNSAMPSFEQKITIYANVSYYLPWIRKTARELYCARNG